MNSHWINYHHLYYFKTIVEEGSVSLAAVKLRVGQPTLSSQLKLFEESIGVSLFERVHKKLILTEHGKIAFDYSKSIFKLGLEMLEVLKDQVKTSKHSIHIGALDSVPKQIILNFVKLAQKIENCHITVSEGNSDQLLRELISHRIDIIITNFIPSGVFAKGLYPKRITKKPVELYGAKDFIHLKKDFPKSISNQPIIMPTYDSKLRYDLDHWAKLNQINFNIVVESQDISMKKLLATNKIGLIPAATHTVTQQVKSGALFKIGEFEGIQEELFLISADRKIENKVAAKILQKFDSNKK